MAKPARQPWFKWFPSDWRADPALHVCSLAARGLWIEMLGIMHEASPRGSLLISGKAPTVEQLAAVVGASASDVSALLSELESAHVFTRRKNGVIVSRRMEKDEEKTRKNRENGKKGGNPSLGNQTINQQSDNRQDKAHIPDTRSQRPDSNGEVRSAGADFLETELRKAAGWQNEPAPMLAVTGEIQSLIDNGADLETDVIPIVRALAPKAQSRTSWRYFVSAIARARDQRVAAATIVSPLKPPGAHHETHQRKPSREDVFAAIRARLDAAERGADQDGDGIDGTPAQRAAG